MSPTTDHDHRLDYWRSLLKIPVDLAVSLAEREMPVDRILKLAPGAMLQFDKACDAPLTIELDGQPMAECEVVKVGDRFGVRVKTVLSRPEHWVPLFSDRAAS